MASRDEVLLAELRRLRAAIEKVEARERALRNLAPHVLTVRERYEMLDRAADIRRSLPALRARLAGLESKYRGERAAKATHPDRKDRS